MRYRFFTLVIICILLSTGSQASKLFIPMDASSQANHLRAYGIAFAALRQGIKVDWLLNYKGGSFAMDNDKDMQQLCRDRGVSFVKMSNRQYEDVISKISDPAFNGKVVKLEKAPKIAVYTPPNKKPWDDAVTLALTYAGIPFDKIYADDVLAGALDKYDWLHLHHEDFTGQFGKFFVMYHDAPWYKEDKAAMEAMAVRNGFTKVSRMQLAVVKKIRDFVGSGGNMFAMCSATETFDIALAADGIDICDQQFDGDAPDANVQSRLDYSKCLAFRDFSVEMNPYIYAHSSIDNTTLRQVPGTYSQTRMYNMSPAKNDVFTLYPGSAKFDQVASMLTQDHSTTIKGFMGQTTAFRMEVLKPGVEVLGDFPACKEARYIHGDFGKGSWTFLGGHDPEDYQHLVGNPVTDLNMHPNSPGYRLILNNVLFPAAEKTTVPTVTLNTADTNANKTTAPFGVESVVMAKSIKIYPNPATDELVITLSPGNIERVQVENFAGQQVIDQAFKSAKVSVSLAGLPSGMFVVKVNGEFAGKVVKQ